MTLEERIVALETKASIAITVAIIFGLGGAGIGGLLIKADTQISGLESNASALQTKLDTITPKINDASTTTTALINNLTQKSVEQIAQTAKSLKFSFAGSPDSISTGAETGLDALTCPEGEVLVEVDLNLGGTCNRQCDPDGRPIRAIAGKCRPIQVSAAN